MKKYYKCEIEMVSANIFGLLLLFVFLLPVFNIVMDYLTNLELIDYVCFFVVMFIWLGLHELLHGIGHLVNGVKLKNITYGIALEKGVFYCLTHQIIRKREILISLMFPFFFIGVVTYIIGLVFNLPLLVILSIINISGACADILMFISFLSIKDLEFVEPGEPTSCYIITSEDLDKKRMLGLKIKESGVYDAEQLRVVNNKLINISKPSYVILTIMFLILLIFLVTNFII